MSPQILDHVLNRRNVGPLSNSTHRGQHGDVGGGPYMIFELVIHDPVIVEAAYQTYGCPVAIGCGGLLTETIKGMDVDKAKSIEKKDLLLLVGGVPEGKEYCAELAINAMRNALEKQTCN